MLTLGLVLIVVAALLVLAEAHLSTGGLIASGAVLALIGGVALLLLGAGAGVLSVLAVSAAVCVAAVTGLALLWRAVRPAGRVRPRSGTPAMVGHLGVVRAQGRDARVFVDGGLWRAQPSQLDEATALQDGDRVVIEHVNGLTLHVRKAEELELYP